MFNPGGGHNLSNGSCISDGTGVQRRTSLGASGARLRRPMFRVILAITLGLTLLVVSERPVHQGTSAASQHHPAGATGTAALCKETWATEPSPNTSLPYNFLSDVAVSPNGDAWAVGFAATSDYTHHALIRRWHGGKWRTVDLPALGASSTLESVAVFSAEDIWAVGHSSQEVHGKVTTLALHWDGKSWAVVATPNPGPNDNVLFGVSVLSRTDAWAVGFSLGPGGVSAPLTLHWDGAVWQAIPYPASLGARFLSDVIAVAPADVWAVGNWEWLGDRYPLIAHWDGHQWTESHAQPLAGPGFLWGIHASSANDVWAVGSRGISSLTVRWNGNEWALAGTTGEGPGEVFFDVSVRSPTEAWAVGRTRDHQGNPVGLIGRWEGDAWALVATPTLDSTESTLFGIAASIRDAWAVGISFLDSQHSDTLTEHLCQMPPRH